MLPPEFLLLQFHPFLPSPHYIAPSLARPWGFFSFLGALGVCSFVPSRCHYLSNVCLVTLIFPHKSACSTFSLLLIYKFFPLCHLSITTVESISVFSIIFSALRGRTIIFLNNGMTFTIMIGIFWAIRLSTTILISIIIAGFLSAVQISY